MATEGRRVKLYQLNGNGFWSDKGTGFVELRRNMEPDSNEVSMIMTSETEKDSNDNSVVLLNTKVISSGDIYTKQGDALIVWNDPQLNQELALSFQLASTAQQVWKELMSVQGKHFMEVDPDVTTSTGATLPPPTLIGLADIQQQVTGPLSRMERERIATLFLQAEDYFPKLFEVHEKCEEELNDEHLNTLYLLFDIFRSILLLNSLDLLKLLFSDKYIMKLIAVLEYDNDLRSKNEASTENNSPRKLSRHRDYFQQVVHKQVVEAPPVVEQLIHNTFKLQYLKDTIIPRSLDDLTVASITGLLVHQQNEIITTLYQDDDFLNQLYSKLETEDSRVNATYYIREMINMAKPLPPLSKRLFLTALWNHNIFPKLAEFLVPVEGT